MVMVDVRWAHGVAADVAGPASNPDHLLELLQGDPVDAAKTAVARLLTTAPAVASPDGHALGGFAIESEPDWREPAHLTYGGGGFGVDVREPMYLARQVLHYA
jgi:hypothetical protein